MDAEGVEHGNGEGVVVSQFAGLASVPDGRTGALQVMTLLALAVLAGCQAPGTAAPRPLTPAEESSARTRGAEAAAALQSTLAPRLLAAIEAGGPAEAVRFCSTAADSLTEQAAGLAGYSLKRTSSRLRNPDNAPDAWEVLALTNFEALAARGDSVPGGWLQVVSDNVVRYYSPLMVAPVCVSCHGRESDLAPGVRELLDERYPADEAIGYEVGDFRGLIRVSLPRAAAEAPGTFVIQESRVTSGFLRRVPSR